MRRRPRLFCFCEGELWACRHGWPVGTWLGELGPQYRNHHARLHAWVAALGEPDFRAVMTCDCFPGMEGCPLALRSMPCACGCRRASVRPTMRRRPVRAYVRGACMRMLTRAAARSCYGVERVPSLVSPRTSMRFTSWLSYLLPPVWPACCDLPMVINACMAGWSAGSAPATAPWCPYAAVARADTWCVCRMLAYFKGRGI